MRRQVMDKHLILLRVWTLWLWPGWQQPNYFAYEHVCNDIPPYPVWDKKVQQFRTYGAVSPFEDNNPNVLQDTLSTKDLPVAKSSVVQKDMEQKSLFWGFQLTLWPYPWRLHSNFVHMTLSSDTIPSVWLQSFSGSADIIRTNIHWGFKLLLWLCSWRQQSKWFAKLWLMVIHHHTKLSCERSVAQ